MSPRKRKKKDVPRQNLTLQQRKKRRKKEGYVLLIL